MTKFNSTHKLTAAAFGAAAIFSMLSFGSSAEASQGPLSCHASSAKKVMECCAETINNDRPSWMIKTGRSCHTSFSASCVKKYSIAGVANLSCYLRPRTTVVKVLDESGTDGTSVTGDPRGPNSVAK